MGKVPEEARKALVQQGAGEGSGEGLGEGSFIGEGSRFNRASGQSFGEGPETLVQNQSQFSFIRVSERVAEGLVQSRPRLTEASSRFRCNAGRQVRDDKRCENQLLLLLGVRPKIICCHQLGASSTIKQRRRGWVDIQFTLHYIARKCVRSRPTILSVVTQLYWFCLDEVHSISSA